MTAPKDNKYAVGNAGGRPSKYKPEYTSEVIALGLKGKSLSQMATNFGVARSTIDQWAKDNEEFSEALTRAKTFSQAWWEDQAQEALFYN